MNSSRFIVAEIFRNRPAKFIARRECQESRLSTAFHADGEIRIPNLYGIRNGEKEALLFSHT